MADTEALEAVRDDLAFCFRSRVTGETRYGAFRREHLGTEDPVPGERIRALVDAGLAAPGERKPSDLHPGVFVELTDAGRAELDR